MKKILLSALLILAITQLFAQDFPFGQVDNQALDMKKYDKDTSAHAVVLNEYGSSRMGFDNDYNVVLTFTYHTKIKFFDSKEFEREGTFGISVYNGDDTRYEEVRDIKGVTFYRDDNGQVQQAELDKSKVFNVRDSKHWSTVKFTMPALRNGCVIEVSYTVISPYLFNFHGWQFQDHIPKVNSEYEVHIPGFWNYNASLRGYLKLTKNTATIEKGCLTYGSGGYGTGGISADCSDIVYGMSDIPAFVDEDYMTSEKNFISAISFQLVEETNMNTGAKVKYTKDWTDIDRLLKENFGFGAQLKRKDLFKEKIAPVIAGKTDELEKARAIYNYIKNSIKWDGTYDFVSYDGIKKALENHTGNPADINLALVTALNAAGIPTEAVMLSTRAHGSLNKLYPDLDNFNYVIAKANIGDKSYLLDATDPLLPFGMLPMRCLNDQGRAFSLDKPSYWVDLNTNQREKVTYDFDLTLGDDGKLRGTIKRYSSGYSGYERRKEIKNFNSVDEYVQNLASHLQKVKILKYSIDNVDSLENPVGESYEIEMDAFNSMKQQQLSFNPFLFNRVTTNPFKLAERDYPVDWGMPSDERYIMTVHLPQQYTVENPPANMGFGMPGNGGKFLTDYQASPDGFTFSHVTEFNKSVYGTDEYPYLKELYNKIILSEKNEIVFQKKP